MLGRAGRKKPDKECRRYFVIKAQTTSKRKITIPTAVSTLSQQDPHQGHRPESEEGQRVDAQM